MPPPGEVSQYGNRIPVPARPRAARPGNCLEVRAPDVVDEWDAEANGEVTPSTIGASSAYPAFWRCRENDDHQWQQPVNQRAFTARGKSCPLCRTEKALIPRRDRTAGCLEAELGDVSVSFSDRNPVRLADASAAEHFDWIWVCPDGHEFIASLQRLRGGFSCGDCYMRRRYVNRVSQQAAVGGVFSLDRPRQRSKEEIRLAAELAQVFTVDFDHDAVRTLAFVGNQPFVTPDILLPELRVAVEWDGQGHRADRTIDDLKESALAGSGWRTVRASTSAAKSTGNVVAAPTGLTLAVVADVMELILEEDDSQRERFQSWRARGRWVGTAVFEDQVERAGATARGASAWRRRSGD